mgnify:CR=1 FL=1
MESLVRHGYVSAVNTAKRQARVCFPDMDNMVSDWLYVLSYPGINVGVDVSIGGTEDPHYHHASAYVTRWFPAVNDPVLVLMEHGDNAAGYVLGVIP